MAQAKKKNPNTKPLGIHVARGLREAALFILGALGIYFLIVLATYDASDPGWTNTIDTQKASNAGGLVGAWFADVLLLIFGYLAYLVPVMIIYSGVLIYRERKESGEFDGRIFSIRLAGFTLTLLTGTALASIHFYITAGILPEQTAGGILGSWLALLLLKAFGSLGSTLLLLAIFLTGITLFTGLSWMKLMDNIGRVSLNGLMKIRNLGEVLRERREISKAKKEREKIAPVVKVKKEKRKAVKIEPVIQDIVTSVRLEKEKQVPLFEPTPNTALPPLSLLDTPVQTTKGFSKEALQAMSQLLELKLQDFGIDVTVESVHPGPVITRFEVQPAAGVKVSQISNLAKDLARSMSVISMRVVEVIPGKSTVGLEIPNEHREMVFLSEILKSKAYDDSNSFATLALGKDISGVPIVVDLAKMPHLLVAGTTGSGKSVAVNAMILSLLYKSTANDIRLIMIDPKMLELSVYEGIPHLLTPVITDMKDSANALRWCVGEMERRYRLMASLGVRNIAGYNRKVKEAIDKGEPILDPLYDAATAFDPEQPAPTLGHLPMIVVVIDEFADMMMVVGKKVEELIARLAQKARAAGIHLIVATQRPSVNVITGLIKANIPTRIAFQVSSKVDSRTILDQGGAEQLLGHGDMLYLSPGTGLPTRVHGAFVDDHEVHRVVDELKKTGEPDYLDDIVDENQGGEQVLLPGESPSSDDESDPLYDEAVFIVTESRRASISSVQRRLKVGYNRAARMIEAMEASGIVSAMQSNGTREVIAPPPVKG